VGKWRGIAHSEMARCGAKTRAGHPCGQFAMPNGRCRFHGGKSSGPRDLSKWHLKHGRFSKAVLAERQAFAALLREVRETLQTMEIDGGR